MKFWAVLGSRGCREKKPPNCRKYATFWGGFLMFSKIFFAHKKLKKPPQTVGTFFSLQPDCPKQPRTSFPFYKLFYTIVSAKVSGAPRIHESQSLAVHRVYSCCCSLVQILIGFKIPLRIWIYDLFYELLILLKHWFYYKAQLGTKKILIFTNFSFNYIWTFFVGLPPMCKRRHKRNPISWWC